MRIATKKLLVFAAAVEGAMGLALMVYPPIVIVPLLGDDLSDTGITVSRVAGFALLALGIACWPGRGAVAAQSPSLRAMLTYNLLIAISLFRLGVGGGSSGTLLWPAFLLHAATTLLLVWAWLDSRSHPIDTPP